MNVPPLLHQKPRRLARFPPPMTSTLISPSLPPSIPPSPHHPSSLSLDPTCPFHSHSCPTHSHSCPTQSQSHCPRPRAGSNSDAWAESPPAPFAHQHRWASCPLSLFSSAALRPRRRLLVLVVVVVLLVVALLLLLTAIPRRKTRLLERNDGDDEEGRREEGVVSQCSSGTRACECEYRWRQNLVSMRLSTIHYSE